LISPTSQRGQDAELSAERYLHQQGLRTIEKNYRSKTGEIDLIMSDRKSLIFVEVRFRKNNLFGSAAESIDHKKQQRIRSTAEFYLMNHKRFEKHAKRFDVIAITGNELEWLQGAF